MQIVIDWSAWDCKNPRSGVDREVIEVEDGFLAWEEGIARAEEYIESLFPDAVFGRIEDGEPSEKIPDGIYVLAWEDDDSSEPIATIY